MAAAYCRLAFHQELFRRPIFFYSTVAFRISAGIHPITAAMAFDFKRVLEIILLTLKKAMKAKILCTIFLLLSLACKDEDVFEKVPPVSPEVFNIDLCPTLLTNVISLFPESKNNQEKYAQLFSEDSQQRIILTKDTDVYVTFVTEAATIGNVLGYYIYHSASTPGSSEDIEKELIFANVDNSYLNPGDTRKLGTTQLKAGTVIGFFLIVNGYRNEGVYYKRPTFYTDKTWNTDQAKQHVLFEEQECGAIVVGFEDKNSVTADKDYNDIIFIVSDNIQNLKNTSFDVQNVVTLSK
jgi:hypothetical protein